MHGVVLATMKQYDGVTGWQGEVKGVSFEEVGGRKAGTALC